MSIIYEVKDGMASISVPARGSIVLVAVRKQEDEA